MTLSHTNNKFLRSLDDPDPNVRLTAEEKMEYKIYENGGKRGGKLLVTSTGYSYTVKVRFLQSGNSNFKDVENRCCLFS
jgi:hypothetical protein